MKLSPEKQKKFLIALVCVIGVSFSLYYFGIYMFLAQKQIRDRNALKKLSEEVKQKKEAILTEKNNRENAKTYLAYIATAEEQMPKGNTETWLVKALSDFAQKHKIGLTNTTLMPMTEWSDFRFKDQPYKLVGFQFSFKAEFNQIGKFIEDLENSMPMLEVDDLTIMAGSEIAPDVHTVSMRISMVTKA